MNLLTGGLVIAAAMAILYGGWLTWQEPSRLRTIIKALSIGSLSLLSYRLGGPLLLTIALALSAVGDAFLANRGERNFILGLGSFLLAHLAYTGLFTSENGLTNSEFSAEYLVGPAILAIITVFVLTRLWPHLGGMKIPVLCYVTAILAMGVSALLLQNNAVVLVGAVMFMASDIILSHEVFVWKEGNPALRHSPWMIWSLYWGGQALIAWAYLS